MAAAVWQALTCSRSGQGRENGMFLESRCWGPGQGTVSVAAGVKGLREPANDVSGTRAARTEVQREGG